MFSPHHLCAIYSVLEQKQVNRVGKYIILQYKFYKLLMSIQIKTSL